MRTLVLVSQEDILKLANGEYVAFRGSDGGMLVIMSEEAHTAYMNEKAVTSNSLIKQ